MSSLINVYSPLLEPFLPPKPIALHRHYAGDSDGFMEHLMGFVQYIEGLGEAKPALIRHIMRTKQRYSIHTDPAPGPNLWPWVKAIRGLLFFPDGNVLDPFGRTWVHPDPSRLSPDATIPYGEGALARKIRNEAVLKAIGYSSHSEPLPDEGEIILRPIQEVWGRAKATGVIGLRVNALKSRVPFSLSSVGAAGPNVLDFMTEDERQFVQSTTLQPKLLLQFADDAEYAFALAWALGLCSHLYLKEKADPSCPWLNGEPRALCPITSLLDQADLYGRIHALGPLDPLNPSTIRARWEALAWLCNLSEWDRKIGS